MQNINNNNSKKNSNNNKNVQPGASILCLNESPLYNIAVTLNFVRITDKAALSILAVLVNLKFILYELKSQHTNLSMSS